MELDFIWQRESEHTLEEKQTTFIDMRKYCHHPKLWWEKFFDDCMEDTQTIVMSGKIKP